MKRLMTATTAIAALTAGAALAATDIEAVDMDGDGFATIEEVRAAFPEFDVEFFEQVDMNGDNRVGPQEILETEVQEILARYEMVPLEERPPMIVLDANMDGFMEIEEVRRAFPDLTQVDYEDMDENDDNRLTYQEYYTTESQDIVARYRNGSVADIAEIDMDGDDFASFDEMAGAYPGLDRESFDDIDENGDNRVSSQELYDPDAQDIISRHDS